MVRPVDMQDNFSKTKGAERVNQIQKSAPEIDQHHAAQQAKQKQVERQRQPQPTERTDEVLIHRDSQREKEKKKEDKKKQEKKKSGLDLTA